jgi:methionyl-tRNA formyltransferase
MDAGMDTGPMLAKWTTAIDPDETAGELFERLSALGGRAVSEGIPKVALGQYAPEAQDESQATTAPMMKKEDGAIAWGRSARGVHDHVRGMSPWPGAFARLNGKVVKVLKTAVNGIVPPKGAQPGEVVLADKMRVAVACGEGQAIDLVRVQLEGRKPVAAGEWVSGRGVKTGDRLA